MISSLYVKFKSMHPYNTFNLKHHMNRLKFIKNDQSFEFLDKYSATAFSTEKTVLDSCLSFSRR